VPGDSKAVGEGMNWFLGESSSRGSGPGYGSHEQKARRLTGYLSVAHGAAYFHDIAQPLGIGRLNLVRLRIVESRHLVVKWYMQ
jgi:hypothetical protein